MMLRREAWQLTRRLVKEVRKETDISKIGAKFPMRGVIGFIQAHPNGNIDVWLPLLCRWWLRRTVKKARIRLVLAEFECDCNCSSAAPTKNVPAPWMNPREVKIPTPPPNKDTREGLIPKPKKA